MTAPIQSKRWHWSLYWVPYEPEWLLIPSVKLFISPELYRGATNRASVAQWSIGIQWGKWYVGFGAHIYPKV